MSDGQIENLLDRLVGCELCSVQFVRDYVQLHFEGSVDSPVLTCYVMPGVAKFPPGAAELVDGSPGFADALRAFIDESVCDATAAVGTGLVIELRTGAIALNPTSDQLAGPEIAMLSGFKDRSWTVWRPGEDEFAELT
ncbi:hypothetical protein [Glycomyces algeriensis]|uniref:Uncharacterized protein n=1 Tax=Glycomyces algeriensis TaxID=256037 RepID=A0A9W6GAR9_9ACTN|nr:hypothetical protein [Glycomyces algeriensis]MDA1364667.1 hypothetical protein [Glycomyces algeriensis]MDR7350707.1 hypothetical protein [Glycomyces algeriensis]GLI43417.1 hypothetical protein GALLR39Z86_32670 [Glycomyces algeriensis]